ncbi:membrane protein insertase YidC [Corynebacterium heidelbergense]|uniref:Membrane protein insertase YidC n=1 Tax=Corynebacterium heidelbergense TaxID=2055947 RepID=A0A364VD38_9CORY|nr:membrane protein insertase YidC [Corynebacterium heidelbergense]RAV34541.1 membrane protein insertase YidC [Corynebacterium heidelbergense]WCZ37615.1 Membrane protein insertase MisCA precursor [Corynebacterium heidelbergense]
MLNFIYYPISGVLWFWHKVFSFVLDPASGLTWALAIIFLVFTVRILLVKPAVSQMRSMRRTQEFQPKMRELQKKHAGNQQKLMEEVRAAQKEMGVNPLASCLPVLVQFPLFLGLFHVLRSFNRTGNHFGELGMSVEQTRNTPNYFFGVQEVQSFLDARLFGAPLSGFISQNPESYAAFSPEGIAPDFTKMNIMVIIVPLMLASAVIMHFTARMSMDRTKRKQDANPAKKDDDPRAAQMQMQMDMMQKMMVWIVPIMYLTGGFLWQIGLALYMFANNSWTLLQQKMLFAKMDREEEEEKEAKLAAKRTSAPRVGARPENPKRRKK